MFTLTIEDGNGQTGERFSFDHGTYVIGRQEDCDIVLPSTSVSRQHARIFVQNGRCYVEDLGSSNGVVVDGQRVVKQRDLGTASQIKVGDYYLYLEYKRPDRGGNVLQTLFISGASDHHKIVRINDNFAGEEFSLSEVENTIGRTDDNFILLSDTSISRHHALIRREADRYVLLDLGSSNGTRLNGKTFKEPPVLSAGDRVQFGNVEFVFAPGHMEINPSDYARAASGSNVVLMVGVAILVVLAVVIGGLVALGFKALQQPQQQTTTATESVEDRIAAALVVGQDRMERRDWDGAITAFNEVLALAPDNPHAKSRRQQADREREAQETFASGEALVEEGRHREAMRVFAGVAGGTVAYDRAGQQLVHVRRTLAFDLRNDAKTLLKGEPPAADLKEAHSKLKEALALHPDDAESKTLLNDVTELAKKRNVALD